MTITPARADLTSLFGSNSPSEPYRQGVIVAFNPATGANQVRVGGAVLENLPVLVGGDTVNFAPDDAVVLLKLRSSWAILGRIVVPGNEALTASAVDFYVATWRSDAPGGLGLSFNITTANQTHTVATIPVPAWANSALVQAQSSVLAANTSASNGLLQTRTLINGVDTGTSQSWWWTTPGSSFHTPSSFVAKEIGPPLGSTITVEGQVKNDTATWPAGGNAGYLNVSAIFRKV